jgi:hypothetical protein
MCKVVDKFQISSRERRATAMSTRVRSAVSGRFVKKAEAMKNPKQTVTEKVKKK